MKNFIRLSFAVTFLLIVAAAASAQSLSTAKKSDRSTAASITSGAGRAGVIVVGSAAKGAWGVTKLTGKYVVLPVAKSVFVKAAPAVGRFAFKKTVKHLAPVAVKMAIL